MAFTDTTFAQDIVLDEAAFDTAIADFEALGQKLETLRLDLEEMMTILKAGFDTPAGVKFINSCEEHLYRPLDDQKLVLQHISATLRESKLAYESVFREYEALQATINQANI